MRRPLLILFMVPLMAALGTACSKAPNDSPLSAQESEKAVDAPPAASADQGYSSTEQAYSTADTTATFSMSLEGMPSSASATSLGNTPKTIHNTPGSSMAARDPRDSTKKFIRTANMRFQVNDVYQATTSMERIAVHFGGWVTHSHIASSINRRNETPVSVDSSLVQTFYTVTAQLVLRVPVAELDTTIRTLSRFVQYLDHRTINAEDISLRMLAESLRQRRNLDLSGRLKTAVDTKGQKLENIADVESRRTDAQARADEATIQKLSIQDQIQYSTITLNVYQKEAVLNEMIANPINIDAYRPGFFARLGEGIQSGWNGLLEFVLALFAVWPVTLILLVLGIVIYRQVRKSFRKPKA